MARDDTVILFHCLSPPVAHLQKSFFATRDAVPYFLLLRCRLVKCHYGADCHSWR